MQASQLKSKLEFYDFRTMSGIIFGHFRTKLQKFQDILGQNL